MAHPENTLILPTTIISKMDVGRILRELQILDEFLNQSSIRLPNKEARLPRVGRLLDEILQQNKMNALLPEDRQRLIVFLIAIRSKAPQIHISFGTDPSPLFLQKITIWLRRQIHPTLLLHVGLQPSIGAGCTIRTTNQYFDFSMRQLLTNKRALLSRALSGDKP